MFSLKIIWKSADSFFKVAVDLKDNSNFHVGSVSKYRNIIISNHSSVIDILILNNLFNCSKKLKYIYKKELRYIPIFGQIVYLVEFLKLSRNYKEDKQAINEFIERIKLIPIYLIMFVEGTRITNENKKESTKFCISKGITPFNNVLCPRYKGFELLTSKKVFNNVIDVTVIYDTIPSLIYFIFSPNKFNIQVFCKTYKINQVKDSKEFLMERFREKDELIGRILEKKYE
ncbi:hypothetical protein NUSPORA_01508 [Nucleospora cyclopteri]